MFHEIPRTNVLAKFSRPSGTEFGNGVHTHGLKSVLFTRFLQDKILDTYIHDVMSDALHALRDSFCQVAKVMPYQGDLVGRR